VKQISLFIGLGEILLILANIITLNFVRIIMHSYLLRRISYGTRTEEGSCVFAILISVIETCRKRQQSPWVYLAAVINNRRMGIAVPKLPIVKGSE